MCGGESSRGIVRLGMKVLAVAAVAAKARKRSLRIVWEEAIVEAMEEVVTTMMRMDGEVLLYT